MLVTVIMGWQMLSSLWFTSYCYNGMVSALSEASLDRHADYQNTVSLQCTCICHGVHEH